MYYIRNENTVSVYTTKKHIFSILFKIVKKLKSKGNIIISFSKGKQQNETLTPIFIKILELIINF